MLVDRLFRVRAYKIDCEQFEFIDSGFVIDAIAATSRYSYSLIGWHFVCLKNAKLKRKILFSLNFHFILNRCAPKKKNDSIDI